MQKTVLTSVFYFILVHLKGQQKITDSVTGFFIGSSFTYIWDPQSPDYINNLSYLYQEKTLQLNLALQWNKRWRSGINYHKIWTLSEQYGKNSYFIAGVFQQYHLLRKKKGSLFAEAGLYSGNYCTCGLADPYKKNGLVYWNIGAGMNLKLSKRFYLDFAFLNYKPFNKISGKYNYTQYVIGLDYKISNFKIKESK